MKRLFTFGLAVLSLGLSLPSFAAADAGFYDVNQVNSRPGADFRPGQVIVKLRTSGGPLRIRNHAGAVTTGIESVDRVLGNYHASAADRLMPLTGSTVARRHARAINGAEVADADLSGLCAFSIAADANVFQVVDELKALPEVEYAEPNYIVYNLAFEAPDDPMYSQQWGIEAISLDKLWSQPAISEKRPVIAILDTGVDISHPDLEANIWTNAAEADGAEDSDDDGNGFADDIHGWDFVNQSARMRDNNGHGTHCAGIAAAVGANGIGIVGANPDALIMPVTVMQSDGTGDVATIIKGIDYAAANGADIISMSFGGYSNSLAERDALAKAYQKAVLVAAAGNDNRCIYPHMCEVNRKVGATMFPAAYNFVLGVEATDISGNLASFSNFDEDGPVTTAFSDTELFNYELRAPGTLIASTFPGGQYRALSGTSMACPLAAGAISRLISAKEYGSKEELFGDLIYSSKGNIQIFDAYSISDADRKPTLDLVTYRLDDAKMGDGDGRADAGETIRLYPTFRNSWGNARNITYTLTLAETEDPEIITFMDSEFGDTHMISNLSSYASAEAENPFVFKVSPNCVDGRRIRMVLKATCDNISAPLEKDIVLTVENGVELGGIIREDMTLTPDKNYIITSMLGVPDGVTLTILPGTTLKFKDDTGISVAENGKVIAVGEPGNMITFTQADMSKGNCKGLHFEQASQIEYCKFTGIRFDQNVFQNIEGNLKNCIYSFCRSDYLIDSSFYYNHENCNIIDNISVFGLPYNSYPNNCNIIGNQGLNDSYGNYTLPGERFKSCNTFNNVDFNNQVISVVYFSEKPYIFTPELPNYLGTSEQNIARLYVKDINYPGSRSFGEYDLSNMLTRPVHEAHGIVWKVVVNGYDAQDEYDMLPPLGVGRHKFEVWFNRQMNHEKAPMIAMGVRQPYTQTAIAEDGSWRTETIDGDQLSVYTAYLTIQGKDNFDGVNTIYVADAEDDEFFPIPIEDVRFRVNVQSAGSMSTGFAAVEGVGRVELTWENPEANFDDMLGYNMYRYETAEDGATSDTIRINETLLTREELTDFDVIPGHNYCYYFKVMRTDMTENSPSKTVVARPKTASLGDANGSSAVDVMDIVTEVNYMIGADPKPFIFEAADVNADGEVDILDVVGTVNIIIPTAAPARAAAAEQLTATYYVENGILHIDSPADLGGIQLTLTGAGSALAPQAALAGMETTSGAMADGSTCFLAYSISGRSVASGENAILAIGDADIAGILLCDTAGRQILAVRSEHSGIGAVSLAELKLVTPNPFRDEISVPVVLGGAGEHEVAIRFFSLDGSERLVSTSVLGYGEHTVAVDTRSLPEGFYMLTLTVDGTAVDTAKVIKQ